MALEFVHPDTTFASFSAETYGSLAQQGLEFGGERLRKVASIGQSGAKLSLQDNEVVANAPLEFRDTGNNGGSTGVLTKADFDARAKQGVLRRNELPHSIHEFTFAAFAGDNVGLGARAVDVRTLLPGGDSLVVGTRANGRLDAFLYRDATDISTVAIREDSETSNAPWLFANISAVTIGDFNGNGHQDVAILDGSNGKVYVYQNDSTDGFTWNTTDIDLLSINNVTAETPAIDIRAANLTPDDNDELVLVVGSAVSAFRFTGAAGDDDLAESGNWAFQTLGSHAETITALHRELLIDVTGTGARDILFGAADGIFRLTRPVTKAASQSWQETVVNGTTLAQNARVILRGSFVTAGASRDLAVTQDSSDFVVFLNSQNAFAATAAFQYFNASVERSNVAEVTNMARLPVPSANGFDSLYVIGETSSSNTSAVFLVDHLDGVYNFPGTLTRVYRDLPNVVPSHIVPHSFRRDGTTQLLEANRGTQLSWYNFARVPVGRVTGTRLTIFQSETLLGSSGTVNIAWNRVLYDGLGIGVNTIIPQGVHAIRVYAAVELTNAGQQSVKTLRLVEKVPAGTDITKTESSVTMGTSSAATLSLESNLLFVEPGTAFVVQLETGGGDVSYGGTGRTFFNIEPVLSSVGPVPTSSGGGGGGGGGGAGAEG